MSAYVVSGCKSLKAFPSSVSRLGKRGGAGVSSPSPDILRDAGGKSDCTSGLSKNFNNLRLFLLTLDGGTFFFGFLREFSARDAG
jgi:hypothetical protein